MTADGPRHSAVAPPTGWAALVVVAGEGARPEVVLRGRAELRDRGGRVRRNVYHVARTLDLAAAAALVEAAERIATEQAAAAFERTLREATDEGAVVRSCAVVVGAFAGARLESLLASHALVHAAEGRLYQRALLRGAEAPSTPQPFRLGRSGTRARLRRRRGDKPRHRIDELRREVGPPWARDQKLAALAAWIALARSS